MADRALLPVQGALTLRDYFAAHAPIEIPGWFSTWFRANYEPQPAAPSVDAWALTAVAREYAMRWAMDPRYSGASNELAEQFKTRHRPGPGNDHAPSDLLGLRSYQQAHEAWRKTLTRWENELYIDTLVSWRWTYAHAMCASAGAAPLPNDPFTD
jgi:hypothetical protein